MSLKETIKDATIADRVIFVSLIIISLTGIIFIKEVLPAGNYVNIEVDGKLLYRYPIDTDRTVHVQSHYGSLDVEMKGSMVRVINATCPNKICERQGWVRNGAIICLPSRIVVMVGGKKGGEQRIDAITR